MSATIALDEAENKLRELIENLDAGEEVAITDGAQVVARLVGEGLTPRSRPGPGLCQGMMSIVADDDEHLRDFAEYMP